MPKVIKNDLTETWTINGDGKTWTLQEQASITVHDIAAIDVLDTSVANTLKLMGDIVASGDDGQGVHVAGVNTKIVLGKQAEIDADTGIDAGANGLKVINKGEIDGLLYGIVNSAGTNVKNLGDISGNTGISTLGTSTVVNGVNGTIQGDYAGVAMSFGSDSTVINKGLISANDFAIRMSNGGETKVINTGTIHGDVLFTNGNDLFDSMKGTIEGTITGGFGDDTFKIGKNAVDIVELDGQGTDSVVSRLSHQLADHIENLTLVGKGNIYAQGNDEDNILHGNKGINVIGGAEGNDELAGGRGDDALMGGLGDDVFVFNRGDDIDQINDFTKGEDVISLGGFDNATTFEDLEGKMSIHDNDVWINFGNGDRLVIKNVDIGDLEASDFEFAA